MGIANAVLRGGPGDGQVVQARDRGRAGAAFTFVSPEDSECSLTYRYTEEVYEHPTYGPLAVLVRTGDDAWGYRPPE